MPFIILLSEFLYKPPVFISFISAVSLFSLCAAINYFIVLRKQEKAIKDESEKQRGHWQRQLLESENKNSELSKITDSLNARLDIQSKEIESLSISHRQLLEKRDAELRDEISGKEKIKADLENCRSQREDMRDRLESKERELSLVSKLRDELLAKEEDLKSCLLENGRKTEELKEALAEISGLKSALKEERLSLERKADALSQALALEKTLHQRLKEEHSACVKPSRML